MQGGGVVSEFSFVVLRLVSLLHGVRLVYYRIDAHTATALLLEVGAREGRC